MSSSRVNWVSITGSDWNFDNPVFLKPWFTLLTSKLQNILAIERMQCSNLRFNLRKTFMSRCSRNSKMSIFGPKNFRKIDRPKSDTLLKFWAQVKCVTFWPITVRLILLPISYWLTVKPLTVNYANLKVGFGWWCCE